MMESGVRERQTRAQLALFYSHFERGTDCEIITGKRNPRSAAEADILEALAKGFLDGFGERLRLAFEATRRDLPGEPMKFEIAGTRGGNFLHFKREPEHGRFRETDAHGRRTEGRMLDRDRNGQGGNG